MASKKKLNTLGYILSAIIIIVAIYLARVTNPFESALPRILYSALFGAIGGASGAGLSHLLGLTKPSSPE